MFLGHFWSFFVVFVHRERLLQNVAKYNCSESSAFTYQTQRVEWQSNQKLFLPSPSACTNHSINLLNSSNHLWDTPDLRLPWSIGPCYNYWKWLLIFLNLSQHAKNQLISLIRSWDTADFREAARPKRPPLF